MPVGHRLPVRRSANTDRHGERGVVLPVAIVLMFVLLLMSALVLDIGMLSLHRRQDQSAADVAIIAGAMSRSSNAAMSTAIVDNLNDNLGTTFTVADLNTCPTPTLPSGWTIYPAANCLSHDTSWSQLRLRLPTRSFETAFAGLAGVDELSHTAMAQIADLGAAPILPFAVTSAAGNYECLKVGAGNVPDDKCSGATSGNFGVVTFGLWGNSQMGTTTDCNGTGTQFVTNTAQGIDHDLSIWDDVPHGTVDVVDTTSCGTIARPNAMTTTTGNTPNNLGAALFGADTFPDGGPSRLRRVDEISWFGTTSVAGATLDDTPLWEFLDSSLPNTADVPDSCRTNQFVGVAGGLNIDNDGDMTALPLGVANHLILIPVEDRMIRLVERCLAHFQGLSWDDHGALSPADPPVGCGGVGAYCTDPIFGRDTDREVNDILDVQASPRFGYVPELVDPTFPSGNAMVRIGGFRAVFLQRVYGGNCSNSGCDVTFDPGVGYTSNVNTDKASALTAFVFPRGSLPNGLAEDDAPNEYGTNRFIELTR
ncbi:MAG: hypothetical protein ACI8TP_001201 [Acidimicrobiales bacterium]|jgi:hypothetical protein